MKFGVVTFPGSNCDEDMSYALERSLDQEVVRLWHKDKDLQGCDMVILPGGFSYGDYLRSGSIARFSPIMEKVVEHADKGGYVLGVCNGFQILCEAHLLPGALLMNESRKFVCKNAHIRAVTQNSLITQGVPEGKPLNIPIAHAEGRYYADEDTLDELEENEQVLFLYCDKDGKVVEEANPNGSARNIAGICNPERNVYGMMPHPERAADPVLGNTDGLLILESILGKEVKA